MKNKKHVRNFSLLLCAALLAGQMGMTVYAEETSSGNRGGGAKRRRKLLLVLGIILVCSNIGSIMPYGAEQDVSKQIEEFEELPEEILYQQVPNGTKKKNLDLPERLRGFVVIESFDDEDTATPSEAKKHIASSSEATKDHEEDKGHTASPSEAIKKEDEDVTVATSSTSTETEDGEWKNIRVKWELDEGFSDRDEYDGEIPGIYVFDAVLARDTYQLASAELPRIVVEVLPGADGDMVTDWKWMDEQELLSGNILSLPGASEINRVGHEIIVSMLPEKISATVIYADGDVSEDLKSEIGIEGWECSDYPEDGGYEGEFIFKALLPEGYTVKDGVKPLQIKVQFGGTNLMTNPEDQIMVAGLLMDDVYQYAKVDDDNKVVYGTQGEHDIHWDAEQGKLELSNVQLSRTVDGKSGDDAVISSNRKDLMIVVEGENLIHVENQADQSYFAVSNPGGGISVANGTDTSGSLTISLEQDGDLGTGKNLGGIDSADGFQNYADIGIDILGAQDRSLIGTIFGIRCGTYDVPAKTSFDNEGSIKIIIDNGSLDSGEWANAYGMVIYGAGMENNGDIDISVTTTNGQAYGLRGTSISEQWVNGQDGMIHAEVLAYGGNIDGTISLSRWSNHSNAFSIVGGKDIHVLNCGTMELKATNKGKNGTYEHAIGLEMDGSGSVTLDNQGDLTASGLEGYSYGIDLLNYSGDATIINSGTITADATTDGHDLYGGGNAAGTGICINLENSGKQQFTSLQLEPGSTLIASASASEDVDGIDVDKAEAHCQAIQLQKLYYDDPKYAELPQEIELGDGLVIRKGGKCFTVLLNPDIYGAWIYINTIGEDESTGPARYVEIGTAIVPDVDWPEVILTYGESLADGDISSGEAFDEDHRTLDGDFVWSDDTIVPSVKDGMEKTYKMSFRPSVIYGDLYSVATGDIVVTVQPKKLSLSLEAEPVEARAGQEIKLQAGISGTIGNDIPKGMVKFSADGVAIAQCPIDGDLLSSATWKNPSAGNHVLSVEYIPVVQDDYMGDRIISINDYNVIGSDVSSDGSDYTTPVTNGKWLKDDIGWRWQKADGTWAQGRRETDSTGKQSEYYRWELINGAWYAFGADCYLKDGMIFDAYYDGWFCIDINYGMRTGWQQIDGVWRYFNPVSDGKMGIMLVDTWIDGWYVDKNGIWNGGMQKEY